LLIALNAGLVLVAVAGMAVGAVRVLRQLADRQALARADLAAQGAAAAIERAGDRVLASARLLADRPSLSRLLAAGDRAGLDGLLDRFRRTSDLTGCALLATGPEDPEGAGTPSRLLAGAGPPLSWEVLRRAAGGRALIADDRGQLVLAGAAPLSTAPRVVAVTARVLDPEYARRLGEQVGLPVVLLNSREAGKAAAPAAGLREQAMAAGAAPV